MEHECHFVDNDDQLDLNFAAITVMVDYTPHVGCKSSWLDPGYPPHIEVDSVALRQIENDTGTINYSALSPDKQKQIDTWIMKMMDVEGLAQLEDHETHIDDEGAYSDEG